MESADRFHRRIAGIFSSDGTRAIIRVTEVGHAGMPPDASIMEQPRTMVCLEGTASFQFQKGTVLEEVELQPRDGLFVAPGRWVRARPRQPYVSMGVVFYPTFARFYLVRGSSMRDWRPGNLAETCITSNGLSVEQRALCELLAGSSPDLSPDRFYRNAFECLLIAAAELLASTTADSGPVKARFTWLAACEYIDHHLHRPISRKDVARYLKVHPNHLSRLFSAFSGGSFSEYVQTRRLERAKLLLTDPRLNIAEVARLSGFAGANYFIRLYKQRTGHTPTRARRGG